MTRRFSTLPELRLNDQSTLPDCSTFRGGATTGRLLVVDLTRYLPGAFASRELQRLGARVVRVEPPEGDPMRHVAPAWDAALNAARSRSHAT